MEIIEYLQYPWIRRALMASVLVGISCGMLGVFIVLRNMALIGDALSHAILPGIVIAFLVFGGYHLTGFFAGAVLAGLVAAVAITWIQQNLPTKNDAAIGIIFTVMFSLGVIGISILSRNEGVHLDLKDFLFGNILAISTEDLHLNYLILSIVAGSVIVFYRYFYLSTFQEPYARAMGFSTSVIHYYLMLLLSFTVVASLQTVGVILVVAMLVTPASTAVLWSDRLKKVLGLAALFGAISAVSGLIVSVSLEIPPGPSMAIMAFIFFAASALFAPQKGFLFTRLRKRRSTIKILREDILKYLYKKGYHAEVNIEDTAVAIGRNTSEIRSILRGLKNKGLISSLKKPEIVLTERGYKIGEKMVRAHRLWESWLVEKAGLREDQIHEDAEFYEHLLDENMVDQIDATLGFPAIDPHGTPIPQKYIKTRAIIGELKAGDLFVFEESFEKLEKWEEETHNKLENRLFEVKSCRDESLLFSEKGKENTIVISDCNSVIVSLVQEKAQGPDQ